MRAINLLYEEKDAYEEKLSTKSNGTVNDFIIDVYANEDICG